MVIEVNRVELHNGTSELIQELDREIDGALGMEMFVELWIPLQEILDEIVIVMDEDIEIEIKK